jgi:hypothetical protein
MDTRCHVERWAVSLAPQNLSRRIVVSVAVAVWAAKDHKHQAGHDVGAICDRPIYSKRLKSSDTDVKG